MVNAGLQSPIRGAMFASEEETLTVAHRLRRAGILVLPAFFPTVSKGTGLIRFAISSLHDWEQIEIAANTINIQVT